MLLLLVAEGIFVIVVIVLLLLLLLVLLVFAFDKEEKLDEEADDEEEEEEDDDDRVREIDDGAFNWFDAVGVFVIEDVEDGVVDVNEGWVLLLLEMVVLVFSLLFDSTLTLFLRWI